MIDIHYIGMIVSALAGYAAVSIIMALRARDTSPELDAQHKRQPDSVQSDEAVKAAQSGNDYDEAPHENDGRSQSTAENGDFGAKRKQHTGNGSERMLRDHTTKIHTLPSCFEILGVDPAASVEHVKQAYHEKIKLYHPDRVSGLGLEIQEVAAQRAGEINSAYEEALAALSANRDDSLRSKQ